MARLKARFGRKLRDKLHLRKSTANHTDEPATTVTDPATATASGSQPGPRNVDENDAHAYPKVSSLTMGSSLAVPVGAEASASLSKHQQLDNPVEGTISAELNTEFGTMGGTIARNIQSTFTSHKTGGLSRSEMTPGSLSPNLGDPLRDCIIPSSTLIQEIHLEEREWSDWTKSIQFPADSNGIVKQVEYQAPIVRLCTLNPSFEAKILEWHQHSDDSSMLRDCYLHDHDVYFLSGYLVTAQLWMLRNSIHKDIYVVSPTLIRDPWTREEHVFKWDEERVFAVVLQNVKFGFGSGIASLGGRFTQFLPRFDGELDGEAESKNNRVEIFLEDW